MFTWRTKWAMVKAVVTKRAPFYIQYFITSRCNLVCKMCNIVKANRGIVEAELDSVEKIADNLVKIGAGVVLLTGGEPFLHPYIVDIVRIFISHGLNVRMQTAGLQTKKSVLEECVRAGVRDICVSLDTLNEKQQDFINGVPGSWDKAIETIANISQLFPPRSSLCALGCVLSRYNYHEVPKLVEFASRIGWFISLVPVHIRSENKSLDFRGTDTSFSFLPEDIPELERMFIRLHQMKKQGYLLFDSDVYLDSALHFIKSGQPDWRKKDVCDSPNLYFAIMPDGEFAVCCDYRYTPRVSVADDRFPAIYRSTDFQKRVKEFVRSCSGCQFGSYPEMSIAVHYPWETLTRAIMLLRLDTLPFRKEFTKPELMEIIRQLSVNG
jgi:MoaA/NifB/PqqE/SkfB family radical SAM enzyme